MEFTLSRVTLGICGIVLLAAVLSPFTTVFDEKEDHSLQDQCDSIAELVDAFWDSDTDNMTLSIGSILPSASCSVVFDGNLVKMTSDDKEFRSICINHVSSDGSYNGNDIVKFTKNEGGISAEKQC